MGPDQVLLTLLPDTLTKLNTAEMRKAKGSSRSSSTWISSLSMDSVCSPGMPFLRKFKIIIPTPSFDFMCMDWVF